MNNELCLELFSGCNLCLRVYSLLLARMHWFAHARGAILGKIYISQLQRSPPELDESWTVKYYNTLCLLAVSYHYTPFATGYFHLVKIREKLDAWQTRVKSSDATQTLDDQPLANSGIYSTLYKLRSYASSTHSNARPLYHLYRSCPYTVTLNWCSPNPR
jgi:hypothetical protein